MTSATTRAIAVVGTWSVGAADTRAQFRARDLLRKTVVGTLPVLSGSVRVAADGTVTAVTAELDLAGVDTGLPKRDKELRGPRFFDVARTPVLRFTGGPAEQQDDGRWTLPGALELRGVTCPLTVAVELLGEDAGRARVRATASLDRRHAGIAVPALLVGHHVDIVVEAVLTPTGP